MKNPYPTASTRPRSALPFLLIALSALLPVLAPAQMGMSPSQNSAFLQELANRSPRRAEPSKDVLGEDRAHLEAGRALSRPGFFNASAAGARRLMWDVSTYAGQYQAGRSYFSPWYDGWQSPLSPGEGAQAPFVTGLALEQTLEYNSRPIRQAPPDWISSTYLLTDLQWTLAENHRLTVSGGVGVNVMFDLIQWDIQDFASDFGLNILPGSTLAYDGDFGPVHLTLYATGAMRTDIFDPLLQNDYGAALTWQMLDDLSWTLNYTHSRSHFRGEFFRTPWMFDGDQESVEDTLSSQLTWQACEACAIGIEAAYSWHEPRNSRIPHRNDVTAWNLGMFTDIRLGQHTRLRLAAGWQEMDFRGDGFFVIGFGAPLRILSFARQQQNAPYYNLVLSSWINDRISHELAAGFESNLDFISNYNESHYVNYGLTARLWKGAQATVSGYFEHVKAVSIMDAFFGRKLGGGEFLRYGLDLHLAQELTRRWSAGVSGHLGWSDNLETPEDLFFLFPEQAANNFSQQALGLNTSYALNERTTLRLAWQYFRSDGLDSWLTGEHQYRVSLSMRVQF